MADLSIHSPSLAARLAGALRAVGDFVELLLTAQPRVAALERLMQLSDEQLAARGTTRQRELHRILDGRRTA